MEREKLIPPKKDFANEFHEYFNEVAKSLTGGFFNPLINIVLPSFHQKRFEIWCSEVYKALLELESKKITLEDLSRNLEFISILKESIIIASKNHQVEKLEIIRKCLLNSIESKYTFDTKFIFTKLIDKLSLTQLVVFNIVYLNLDEFRNLNKYREIYNLALSFKVDLKLSKEEFVYILKELETDGLIKASKDIEDDEIVRESESFVTDTQKTHLPYLTVTDFGEKFYNYIENKE